MAGAIMLSLVLVLLAAVTAYLVGTLIQSIRNEKRTRLKLWKNFGLSLGFCGLFLLSWAGHAVAEWQVFTDEQADHNQPTEMGDFLAKFSQATLENWQSEFLQLFSFTVMAAVLIHKGSAESRDSDDLIQEALKRIEDKLETEPTLGSRLRDDKDLHVIPSESQGWALKFAHTQEPEGFYDLQEDAIAAGRQLAAQVQVDLVIHRPDGTIRQA